MRVQNGAFALRIPVIFCLIRFLDTIVCICILLYLCLRLLLCIRRRHESASFPAIS
jgi:hypothetical protein